MQIFINNTESDMNYDGDSLLELLKLIQDEAEKKEETIVKIIVDDMENSVDLSDEDSDISIDYIDKLDVYTEHIDDVSVNIVTSFTVYFENVLNLLPAISEKIETPERIEAVDNIYEIVDGIKQMNIAFNSMAQMGKIDVMVKTEETSSVNDILVSVNDVIIAIIDKIKSKEWSSAKDLLEFDLSLKINELINVFPYVESQLKGE